MSRENVEVVRAVIQTATPDGTDAAHLVRDDAAWAASFKVFAAIIAPEFVYEDRAMPDHVGETFRGMEGYRRAVETYTEPFETMIYDLERIVDAGDRVVSIHQVRATARHTGISFDFHAAYVFSFQDGRIVRMQGFLDPSAALKAVRLEE